MFFFEKKNQKTFEHETALVATARLSLLLFFKKAGLSFRMTRVLIIDDATLLRRFYRQALEPAGFVVEEALNGVEALEKHLLSPFDLLIVDVNMPHMDGLTFVRSLRAQEAGVAATPVLMTSTEKQVSDRLAARAAGANFYLEKPVAHEILLRTACLMTGVAG
jgi:two-component system chemotaxis response regulator CheY